MAGNTVFQFIARETATLPLDRLLTETDAPFTVTANRTSVPHDVAGVVELLAQVKGVSVVDVRSAIAANAQRVFSFVGLKT